MAAYEDKGKLNSLLSLDGSPNADGSFELAGLTPGTYRIQATMDDIWLSPSIRMTLKPGMDADKPLSLDIGRPGRPSILELVRADGKPARGAVVAVVRPPGPLTDRLWPMEFTSDGAGAIALPPLEVGTHKLRVKGMSAEETLQIPALTEASAQPIRRRIELKN